MASHEKSRFLRRFDRIWSQARRVQLVQALCWGILTVLAGLGLLAAADYWLEMSRPLRQTGLAVAVLASLGVAIGLVIQSLRKWQRTATAATIEEVFPQLGQRIRTTVQYGELSSEEIQHEGVVTTLVDALEEDTVKVAQPLPLDAVIPWKSLAVASLLAAVLGITLTAAAAFDWQWQTAAKRTFLGEEPYTRIYLEPGKDIAVREGESVVVQVIVEGRPGDHLIFESRRLDEENGQWRTDTIPLDSAIEVLDRQLVFEVPIDRVKHPLEYRVAAGSAQTDPYKVDVLYPLKIVKIQAAILPPAYTGIGEAIVEGGNISALVGSKANVQIELDRAPSTAWLELQKSVTRRNETPAEPEKVPLVIEGTKLSADLVVTTDQTYAVVAHSGDGMELPESKYRIRARQDEAPQVWFESPAEALEVHTLAELLMRIRVNDDFGISRAGIVFEVNNEEEYPLLNEDFQAVAEAAEEVETTGKISPKTRSTLEKVLPLEHFELTQQDSIMYYAFAEDIRPENPNRTETDLRFVDIRPFRRQYRVLPEMDGMPRMNQGPQLKSLEELIARQRYALNRTIQMSRKFERSGQADLSGVDNLIKFEGELAKSTRELAQGLIAMGVDETELLFQAETSMLAATDSLSAGSYDTATLQMRDALKNLIEGRNRLEVFIRKNRDRQLLAQLRQFDRLQQQKLRRPKSDEEEARQIAERLKELADREDFLYQTIASTTGGSGEPEPTAKGELNGGEPKKGDKPRESTSPEGSGKPIEDAEKQKDGENKSDKSSGEGDDEKEGSGGKMPSPQEIEDKQLDVALEAREIEKALGKLPKATDLAKERIANASKMAEDAASSLGRGAMQEAQNSIGEARQQFRELSEQVRALMAEEQADRIAAAQQMASELARQQQEFVDRLATPGEGGGQGQRRKEDEENKSGIGEEEQKKRDEEKRAGLGADAEEIADKAKTLQDVLGAAGKSDNPEDQTAAKKVEEIVGSIDLKSVVERLDRLPDQVKSGNMEDAKNNAGDGAERMESAAEQLASLHRVIVAPQVDELAKVEERITVLSEELDQLDTEPKVAGWHEDANDLLEDLDELGIDEKLRQEFIEEMKKAGWGNNLRNLGNGWVRTDGFYRAPGPYRVYLSRLQASVQSRMQELMLGDLLHSGDEPIPPQYQELVDKYYQVLVSSGKNRAPAKPAAEAQPKK